MFPTLWGEGEWAIPSYFVMIMVGFLVGVWLLRREGERQGFDGQKAVDMAIILLVVGVAGARLFHVLFDGFMGDYIDLCFDPEALGKLPPNDVPCTDSAVCETAQNKGLDIGEVCNTQTGECVPQQDCFRTLKFWSGGLTYYGGLVTALPIFWLIARRWKWNILQFGDIVAPVVALVHFFGRMGCYLSGCCYGAVCDLPWAVQFPAGSDAWRDHREHDPNALVAQFHELGEWLALPVHPTQLYEAGSLLLVFALLWFGLLRRKRFHGQVLGWFLILYAVARFTVEFWRADQRGAAMGLSTSQWISLMMFSLGIWLLWWGATKLRRQGAEGLDEGDEDAQIESPGAEESAASGGST